MRATLLLLLGAILGQLGGCASVPRFHQRLDRLSTMAVEPRIVGAHGRLSIGETRAIIDRISADADAGGMLQRHLAVERTIAGTPLVGGNRTRILLDGPGTFPAIFSAIRGARHHINLEYYTIEDVECGGVRLIDLLLAKRAQGVAVNIIYDSFGSLGTPRAFFRRLRAAGANLLEINPLNPFDARDGYSPNNRDHRKILVVDGRVAIVGGVNLSTSYQSNPLPALIDFDHKTHEQWRDIDIEIEGPVVAQVQRLFLAHWAEKGGKPLEDADFFPAIGRQGDEIARFIGSSPDDPLPRYYVTLLSAIRNAEKSIWLSAAYFVPTHEEMDELENAARRGVDVRLLVPTHSDSEPTINVAHSHYEDLLEAGVKIYEIEDAFLHSKTIVIDNVWSAIGSSNFDQRSVLFNDEVDVVVLGRKTAQEVEAALKRDLGDSHRIELATWRDRPFTDKMVEFFASLFQTLL